MTQKSVVQNVILRDTIEAENIGKVFGLVNGFVAIGLLTGPAVAGVLLDKAGYWPTWSAALVVIALDIVMRLVMIEKPRKGDKTEVEGEEPWTVDFQRGKDLTKGWMFPDRGPPQHLRPCWQETCLSSQPYSYGLAAD